MTLKLPATALLLSLAFLSQPAHAYIDLAPSLAKIISQSGNISVVEITDYDRDTHTVTLKVVQTLKGLTVVPTFQHQIATAEGVTSRAVAQWAVPGNRAVVFGAPTASIVCVGTGWYQVAPVKTSATTTAPAAGATAGAWKLAKDRPDLPLAYYGSVSKLQSALETMLAGNVAEITAVAFSVDNEAASFDLALNRQSLPGIVRIQRLRATTSMPESVAASSANTAYFIGEGPVDEDELPALIEKLKSPDASLRADAAEDLRSLARAARSAAPALTSLLADPNPRARLAAASALLVLTPKAAKPIEVLSAGLASPDLSTRRTAAAAAGFTASAGSPFVEKLTSFLADPDETLRTTALLSISMLGPTAEKSVPALTPLLDKPDLTVDVADALGRIGPAAAPALPKLAKLLESESYEIRWAAVRAMSQIGTPDSHPAVTFLVNAMPKANEVEGYNMMIYFALLGPVAQDALPSIQAFHIKNPFLTPATVWAIAPEKSLPWQTGFFGGRGGRGGGPGGGGGMANLNTLMLQAYVHELGPRLRPVSPILAQKIMDNTAGDVPLYGYKILAAAPDLSLPILLPYLTSSELSLRQRATVAVGYMGESATTAKPQITAALAKAATEKEKLLLQWCLAQIDTD